MSNLLLRPEADLPGFHSHSGTSALALHARITRVIGPPPLARIHSDTPRLAAPVPRPQHPAVPDPSSPAARSPAQTAPEADASARRRATPATLSVIDTELQDLARMAEGSPITEAALRRARAIFEEAYAGSSEVRLAAISQAREQAAAADGAAEQILERARTEASRIKTQAAIEAQLALQRTQRHADQVVARARGDAERLVREARALDLPLRDQPAETAPGASAAAAPSLPTATAPPDSGQHPLEAEFDAAARDFVKWQWLPARPAVSGGGFSIFRRGTVPAARERGQLRS